MVNDPCAILFALLKHSFLDQSVCLGVLEFPKTVHFVIDHHSGPYQRGVPVINIYCFILGGGKLEQQEAESE